MKYELLVEKGEYAVILRGEQLKEIAVVNGLNKEEGEWEHTCNYWEYEYNDYPYGFNKSEALSHALDYFRMKTEDNYIPRCRLEELATLFKDGLIEDGEAEAMEYFEEICEMTDEEKEFFGISESEEEE